MTGEGNAVTGIAEKLKVELLQLPTEDRAQLAYCLIRSLDESEDETDTQAVWEAELERRHQEMRSGAVVGKPAESVFAELRKKYP